MDLKYNEAQSDVKILWNKKYYEVIYIKTLELFKGKLSLTFKVLMLLYVICNAGKNYSLKMNSISFLEYIININRWLVSYSLLPKTYIKLPFTVQEKLKLSTWVHNYVVSTLLQLSYLWIWTSFPKEFNLMAKNVI